MKSIKKLFLVCALSLCAPNLASAQLPPEVQADLLQEQIVDSLKAKDYRTVKDKIFEYKNLGVTVPPAILLINAKIAIQEEDFQEGQSSLEEYFNAGGKEHKSYQEALSLYRNIQPKVKAEQARQAAIIKAEQDKKNELERLEKERIDLGTAKFYNAFRQLEELIEKVEFSHSVSGTNSIGYNWTAKYDYGQMLLSEDADECSFNFTGYAEIKDANVYFGNNQRGLPGPNDIDRDIVLNEDYDVVINQNGKRTLNSSISRETWTYNGKNRQRGTGYILKLGKYYKLIFSSNTDAQRAINLLNEMIDGCDIVSGK